VVQSTIPFHDLYKYYSELSTTGGGSYAPLPTSEWRKLVTLGRVVKLKKKEVLVRAGDDVKHGYIVLSGLLRMFYTDEAGKEFIKAFRMPYDSASPYGELMRSVPSQTTICAIEESEVFQFLYKDFIELSTIHPAWEKISLNILKSHFLFKEKREYELLILDASERYDRFIEEFPTLIDRVPQFQIASYLGINPVTLSRILAQR
jgi:CRP-like cAMP-binding protein